MKKYAPEPDEVNVYPCAKEKAKCVSLFEDEEISNNVKREGSRAPITELTRKWSNRMKYVLRNSSCDFQGLIMLTYPRYYPRDGKTCKKHLNLFPTHLRHDYKGTKYFRFMEFPEVRLILTSLLVAWSLSKPT